MAMREQTYGQMREELEDSRRMREKGDEKFQTFILEEARRVRRPAWKPPASRLSELSCGDFSV